MSSALRKTHPLIKIINNALIDLPAPSNISFIWNFGSLLGLCLIIQVLTGIFLSLHFSANTEIAFRRISHISRDVNYGWLIRIIHSNGASIFFIFFISSYRSGDLLFFLPTSLYLIFWSYFISNYYNYSFLRLCFTLRTNIFLRSYCNYKSLICYSLHWKYNSILIMGGILSWESYINPIFFFSFSSTFYLNSLYYNPFSFFTSDRLF